MHYSTSTLPKKKKPKVLPAPKKIKDKRIDQKKNYQKYQKCQKKKDSITPPNAFNYHHTKVPLQELLRES
jgi:hypothetical protein